jgi:hypothetical protein
MADFCYSNQTIRLYNMTETSVFTYNWSMPLLTCVCCCFLMISWCLLNLASCIEYWTHEVYIWTQRSRWYAGTDLADFLHQSHRPSIRVTNPTDGLEWPLNVHGYVAARDTIDHNRNYLFRRERDNFQTLTQEVSTIYLPPCVLISLSLFCCQY